RRELREERRLLHGRVAAADACAGEHGRRARACRAEAAQVAKAETRASRRHHGAQVATSSSRHRRGAEVAAAALRHRHADVAETAPRHGKAKIEKAKLAVSSTCRKHPHARACRAYDAA
ncbi:MAG: hypothetical protein INR64_13480, partial [Caulobacteraceae bacterium]|nr:hypothetical protein [Caulobacter sp.]